MPTDEHGRAEPTADAEAEPAADAEPRGRGCDGGRPRGRAGDDREPATAEPAAEATDRAPPRRARARERRRPSRRRRAEPEPVAVEPRTVGRFIADALRAAGVRYAFTVPGESFLGLLDALRATPGSASSRPATRAAPRSWPRPTAS